MEAQLKENNKPTDYAFKIDTICTQCTRPKNVESNFKRILKPMIS